MAFMELSVASYLYKAYVHEIRVFVRRPMGLGGMFYPFAARDARNTGANNEWRKP